MRTSRGVRQHRMGFGHRAAVIVVVAALAAVAAGAPSLSPDETGAARELDLQVGDRKSATGGAEEGVMAQRSDGEPRWLRAACELPPEQLRRTIRGYYGGRSPELTFVAKEPHYFGDFKKITTHSGPWPYVQRVPLVLYGPGYIRSRGTIQVDREVTVADLAPTFAELLRTPFPDRRPGRVLRSALLPRGERATKKPRLLMTIVWDGGGWNTLNEWPGTWPNLRRLIDGGVSVEGATVGSSPSVTPAIHATMGTGTFPASHGIVSIPQRRSGRIEDSWAGHSPHNMMVKSLADLYDPRTRNRAKVGMVAEQDWHLGMIGHGAFLDRGDKDVAVLTRTNPFDTNRSYYRLPAYIQNVRGFRRDVETIDRSDGKNNGKWLGHPLPEHHGEGFANPAWTLYQMRLLRRLLKAEGFGRDGTADLFYTNFKQIDEVSHAYFLQSPEMKATIPYSDQALRGLVRWMDNNVGKRRWVLALTADHGVGPRFEDVGAWPINMDQLLLDVAVRFNVRVTELFDSQRPQGFWLDRATMQREGITMAEISNFLLDYEMRDNRADGQNVPVAYETRMDERLFSAAFPSNKVTDMSVCKGAAA